MTSNDYLRSVIATHKAPTIDLNDWRLNNIKNIVTEWAGGQLDSLKKSGSNAKNTAINGVTDFDLFISLKSTTKETLKELYNMLDSYVSAKGIYTKKQNVSIKVSQSGLDIDLVPGKIQSGYQNYHSLYISKTDSWMKTNIDLHIQKVNQTKRNEEIILAKRWREINNLKFPSIYLELSVIEAIKHKTVGQISNNFWTFLIYLRNDFTNKTILDPANSNNKISDSIYKYQKEEISEAAKIALTKNHWSDIVW